VREDSAGLRRRDRVENASMAPTQRHDQGDSTARQAYADGERSINSDFIEATFAAAGAYGMGRCMFEGGAIPWGDTPPFRAPVFVVTLDPARPCSARTARP
jgi:hypothetical protein